MVRKVEDSFKNATEIAGLVRASEAVGAEDSISDARADEPINSGLFGLSVPALSLSQSDASAPSQELSSSGRNHDQRTGRFLPGHTASLKTGEHSPRVRAGLLPEQAVTRVLMLERADEIVRDKGGKSELSALLRDRIADYGTLSLIRDNLVDNVVQFGVMTTKGRQRAAVGTLLKVIERMDKLAALIGLGRVAKPALTGFDYLDAKARQAAQAGPEATNGTPVDTTTVLEGDKL